MGIVNKKFNENTQIFSQKQVSRIFEELKLNSPGSPAPKPVLERKTDGGKTAVPPAPEQSVEDLLKNSFIAEEPV